MRTPRVEFDLGKIRANSTILCERLRSVGIDVKGVTKGVGGDSQIAAAMLDGGVTGLASHIRPSENIERPYIYATESGIPIAVASKRPRTRDTYL